jgi:hypothetical protein
MSEDVSIGENGICFVIYKGCDVLVEFQSFL